MASRRDNPCGALEKHVPGEHVPKSILTWQSIRVWHMQVHLDALLFQGARSLKVGRSLLDNTSLP